MQEDIVLVDKPAGWTSFDVVAKLRGKRRAEYLARDEKPTKRQLRVGHAGTLDPFATGLLVILYGEACKRAGEFQKLDKVYEATIRLGQVSSTGDPEGEITNVSDVRPSMDEITAALATLTGEITQRPPAHSAIKIDGVRAYKLARQGKDVEVPERAVTVYSLECMSYEYPLLTVRAHVSSGTYIRTLAESIGDALGTGAYCHDLRRTKIADLSIEQARSVKELTGN